MSSTPTPLSLLIKCPGPSDVEANYQNQVDAPESTLLDYTFATINEKQRGPTILPGDVRKIRFDPDSPLEGQGLSRSTFDIIVALDISSDSYPEDSLKFMGNVNRLLQPGGYFVAEVEESRVTAELSGPFWQQTALDAKFSRAELHPTYIHTSFALEAQKPSWPALPWNSVNTNLPLVIDFALEQILQHQQTIQEYDNASMWVSATSGIESAAALGFARSLRREIHPKKVHLVLFDPIWTPKTRLSIISDLSTNPDMEVETLIDHHGHVYVPRLVRCTAKSIAPDLDLEQYWQLNSEAVIVKPLPLLSHRHEVLVRVTHLSFAIGSLHGFVGHVADPGSTAWLAGQVVVGLVDSDRISNHFLVHEGQITSAPDEAVRNLYATCAVPVVLLAIALHAESIHNPVRLQGLKFLVTNADEPTSRRLTTILLGLGADVGTTTDQPTDIPLEIIRQSDFIFSGYSSEENIQVIQSAMSTDALALWWNGPPPGREIRRNPWIVGDALSAIKDLKIQPPVDLEVASPSPEEHLAQHSGSYYSIEMPLLNSQKSYLLIGGIGSLGLSIALWMYQVSISILCAAFFY
jgi:hypothetical protein